jgi:hypothetical protein
MLSVLLLRAVWRGNVEAVELTFSFEGSSTHRQQLPGGVFVFGRLSKRRRGRQVVRQRSAKPAQIRGSTWFQ